MVIEPPPIRISVDEWVVIRNNPRLPAAVISRQRTPDGREYFRAVTFDLDRTKRELIGRYPTLEAANDAVRYDNPHAGPPTPPHRNFWPSNDEKPPAPP